MMNWYCGKLIWLVLFGCGLRWVCWMKCVFVRFCIRLIVLFCWFMVVGWLICGGKLIWMFLSVLLIWKFGNCWLKKVWCLLVWCNVIWSWCVLFRKGLFILKGWNWNCFGFSDELVFILVWCWKWLGCWYWWYLVCWFGVCVGSVSVFFCVWWWCCLVFWYCLLCVWFWFVGSGLVFVWWWLGWEW